MSLCPLCQKELKVEPDQRFDQMTISTCPAQFGRILHFSTHYRKYFDADWGYSKTVEQIIIFPYKLENVIYRPNHVGAEYEEYCSIAKYKERHKLKGIRPEIGPTFIDIMKLNYHVPILPYEQMKNRFKTLVTFS